MSSGWKSHPGISSAQLQCDLVCTGQGTFIYVMICIYSASFYTHSIRAVHHSEVIMPQTFRMSLTKNKTNLFSSPNGPVLLIWCSSCTDPNIMQFPSPDNLHTAQQTDKYLIGQPSVPSPHGSSYSGHESTAGCECHVSLWESKPVWGQSPPRSPADASPAGGSAACLPGREHHTDARAWQMNKHKDPEQLQGVAALSLIKQSKPFVAEDAGQCVIQRCWGLACSALDISKVRGRGYVQCEVETGW